VIQCCSKPQRQNLSFKRFHFDGSKEETPVTHIFCFHCRQHIYGEGEGKLYTGKQWYDWINGDGELGETENQRELFA
jgi:hypothetical protein